MKCDTHHNETNPHNNYNNNTDFNHVLFWFIVPIQTFVFSLCLIELCWFTMYINTKNITLHGFIRLCFHLNVNVNMLGMCRAHGYVYTASTNTSFVPNSRVDSERASVSSGGRTDSDTMSLSSCSMWVVPHHLSLLVLWLLKYNLGIESMHK